MTSADLCISSLFLSPSFFLHTRVSIKIKLLLPSLLDNRSGSNTIHFHVFKAASHCMQVESQDHQYRGHLASGAGPLLSPVIEKPTPAVELGYPPLDDGEKLKNGLPDVCPDIVARKQESTDARSVMSSPAAVAASSNIAAIADPLPPQPQENNSSRPASFSQSSPTLPIKRPPSNQASAIFSNLIHRSKGGRRSRSGSASSHQSESNVSTRARSMDLPGEARQALALKALQARLDEHVTEVRLAEPVVVLEAPAAADFQYIDQHGKSQFNWIGYVKAHIRYVIFKASIVSEDPPETFSLTKLRSNSQRLGHLIEPLQNVAIDLHRIAVWENTAETSLALLIYGFLWWHNALILTMECGLIFALLMLKFKDFFADLRPMAQNTEREKDRRKKMEKNDSKTMAEWYDDIRNEVTPQIQKSLGDLADYLERFKNLATWKRPYRTAAMLAGIIIISLLGPHIPAQMIYKCIGFALGFGFFVLTPLMTRFPRHSALFNPIEWLLWDIPTDAEYAMEVMRMDQLERHASPAGFVPETVAQSMQDSMPDACSNANNNGSGVWDILKAPMFGGSQPASTESSQANLLADGKVTMEPVPTRSLAMAIEHLAHASSHSKPSIDDSDDDDDNDNYHSVFPDDDDDDDNSIDANLIASYRAMHKSLIGRIYLYSDHLSFRSSRIKSINLLFAHTKGLEVTRKGQDADEDEKLVFDHVMKRNECFNKLIACTGKKWRRI
ncbi:hypothetical protein BZG36_01954 [Bifiguratus adelaidae]|uniref:GRAM domain-containing protein n=1 Tax=Bifiguratus adelaidae TaxID=1938954 RepID=A0A261Y3U6_9FUNG|nr:hypothetical protein BZG36_01954 [Bifiguratus adelaidae]